MTHRALICAGLAEGKSVIQAPLISDDTLATKRTLENLGVEIKDYHDFWEVHGGCLKEPNTELDCGESGTTLRFMSAVCALVDGVCTLTGGPSLSSRPVGPLVEGLKQMGVDCKSDGGHPPVTVNGIKTIRGGEVEIPGDISSQFISALLLVSPFAESNIRILLTTPLESKPYVKMTTEVQKLFGVDIQVNGDMSEFIVEPKKYRSTQLMVEGDWSSAAFILAAGASAGEVIVKNLNIGSSQSDVAFLGILEKMGVEKRIGDGKVETWCNLLEAIELDLTDAPDLFPITAVLCALASGESSLKGLRRLRYKESDRVRAMTDGLREVGISVERKEDNLIINGGKSRGGVIHPFNDHRIAMAFSVLGLTSEENITIRQAECVAKSYPNFWKDFESIGVKLERDLL
jgi:3-phosphoshikimate 1-carboxyvinyltransferase